MNSEQNLQPFPPTWGIMPILAHPEYTRAAIADVLAQSVPVRLLLINQGVDDGFRQELERIAEADDRVLLWSHQPPLLSLAATWNCALDYVWAVGGEVALVVNNDVRLHPRTISTLRQVLQQTSAYFVSCVGVTPEQFAAAAEWAHESILLDHDLGKGGPDFSCFLISHAGHEKYRFDEGFVPAYGEDCDTHRRYMLGGDGQRIFSVNLPFLHYASGTLKSLPPAERSALERRIDQSRAYYARKWGGGINDEIYTIPFTPDSAKEHVTNPELQEVERRQTCREGASPSSAQPTES